MTDQQTVQTFAKELRLWWRFNDYQQPQSSWHEREDFIEKKLPELLNRAAGAVLSEKIDQLLAELKEEKAARRKASAKGASATNNEG